MDISNRKKLKIDNDINYIDIVLQKISKLILYLTGWKFIDKDQMDRIYNIGNKSIWTFSHTSTWDAIVLLLYKYAYPEYGKRLKFAVKPQVYDVLPKWTHSILDNIGFIKATAYENKNGGFVKFVVERLQKEREFSFLISPKGMRDNSPWRSGYYVIAKELNCELVACGLDYEKKKIIVFDPITIENRTKEEIDRVLQEKLEDIVPLNPECSEINLREYKKQNISIVAISFAIIALMIFMTYLSFYYKILFIGILILFFILL